MYRRELGYGARPLPVLSRFQFCFVYGDKSSKKCTKLRGKLCSIANSLEIFLRRDMHTLYNGGVVIMHA